MDEQTTKRLEFLEQQVRNIMYEREEIFKQQENLVRRKWAFEREIEYIRIYKKVPTL
jgi:hypothetical protein